MSKNFASELIIKPKVSVGLAFVLVFLHAGAAFILFAVALPTLARLLLVVLLIASLGHAIRRHALRYGSGAVDVVRVGPEPGLLLRYRGRKQWRAATIGSRFVHRWIVLLSARAAGRRLPTTLVLTADAIEPDVFRRLRAALLVPPRNPAE